MMTRKRVELKGKKRLSIYVPAMPDGKKHRHLGNKAFVNQKSTATTSHETLLHYRAPSAKA